MSIRILTGKPQQFEELSSIVYREIGEAIHENGKDANHAANLFLVVPEQFTLGAERALMSALNQPGLIEADVLSLKRLSSRIMTECGGKTKKIINDRGRILILAKVVQELRNELKLYHRSSYHTGFVKSISDLLTEIKQNCISVQDLIRISEKVNPESWTGQKLSEMIAVFQKYESELDESQWDIDQYTRYLCENIRKSKMLHHAKIWMDGFFTFSANDFAIIEAIAGQADELTITLSGDLNPLAKEMQIFSICRDTAEKFSGMANKTGKDFHIEQIFEGIDSKTPYDFLRDEVFSFHPEPWPQKTNLIDLHHYQDPWQEALCTAEEIAKSVREKGWHYRDIVILCGSLEENGKMIQRALSDLNIPSFCDLPIVISEDPLIEGFLSAIEAASGRYKESALFAYAKSGYASVSLNEWNDLENYVLAKGIKGKKWEKPIEDEKDRIWDYDVLESCRKKLMEPLKEFQMKLKQSDAFKDYLLASVDFLDQIHAYDTLIYHSERLVAQNDFENAGRIRQVWNLLMSVFDQIDVTMGDTVCDAGVFLQVVKSGLATCKVGVLPNRRDVVQIIDPFRSRGGKVKAIFILSANEGILPFETSDYPLFSEDDREYLYEFGLKMQDDAVFRRSRMDYSIYLQMLRATEHISLSWCLSDSEGKSLQPSSLSSAFCRVFPFNPVHAFSEDSERDWIFGGARTLDEAIRRQRVGIPGEKEIIAYILNWYSDRTQWHKQAKMGILSGDYHGIETKELTDELIHGLYGENLTLSVSRVEKYNACPFAHFMTYGLKLRPRKIFEVNPVDMGSLLHEVIEKCFLRMEKDNLSVKDMTEKVCFDLVNGVMNELLSQSQFQPFTDNASSRFLTRKLRRVSQRTIRMISEHLRKGEFNFQYAESQFVREILSPDFSQQIKLKGKIDRIDLYSKDKESFIKIIDYKTGTKEIDFSQIYYGVSIQLFCYLEEAKEWLYQQFSEQIYLPAGAFYFHVDDPLIQEIDREKLEEQINESFKMKGLFLDDADVIQALDIHSGKKSLVFEKGSQAHCLSKDDFEALIHFVREEMMVSIMEILRGEITPKPLKTAKFDACAYCDYRQICQLDRQITPQAFFQTKEGVSKDGLLEKAYQMMNQAKDQNKGGDEV